MPAPAKPSRRSIILLGQREIIARRELLKGAIDIVAEIELLRRRPA